MDDLLAQLQTMEYLTLRLFMRAEETLEMPVYKGSTLRGAFGMMFKDVVCVVPHRDCTRCVLRTHCAYPYVFETPIPETAQRMRKYPAAPHPFVILPTLEEKRLYKAGESLFFDLTLIGRGMDYVPYFVYTFAQFSERRGLGKQRGKCTLTSVQWQSPAGDWLSVYENTDQMLKDCYQPATLAAPDSDSLHRQCLTLSFLTPTRLVFAGRLVSDLQFHILCRTLLRRLSNLMYFHCGTELDVDFKALIQAATQVTIVSNALQWYEWQRFSARQHRHVRQGGLVGQITYQGAWQPFLPLLQLGTVVHVGKSTGLGMGKFAVL